ncbi:MAG: arginase family protein [Gemmatimonadota bacterium]|nr:arginase family protein [Gemmatimonadota bacterium]
MELQIIQVPYDSGHRSLRMGRGPAHLLDDGLRFALTQRGHHLAEETIEAPSDFRAEIATSFALSRVLSERVRAARRERHFPLILSGNCGTALGTVAAFGAEPVAVIWLDAHGDFNTPDTTPTGFLDGMALATLTGRAWTAIAATVPGHHAVAEHDVVHIGGRALDPAESSLLDHSQMARVPASRVLTSGMKSSVMAILDRIKPRVKHAYLHVDLDVLDVSEGRANEFAEPGGLTVAAVLELVEAVAQRFAISAAALTAYDPAVDRDGAASRAAQTILAAIADRAA